MWLGLSIYMHLLFFSIQDSIQINHKKLIIEVAPQIGGRISSLQYNDLEVLKIKRDDEHIMWGSTLWPAPHAKPILAYRNQGLLFIKIFPVVTTIDIAPEQSPIEIYYDPNNKFVELENHSKYTTIAPGEEMNYQVTWYLMPVEAGDTVKKMIAEIINQ